MSIEVETNCEIGDTEYVTSDEQIEQENYEKKKKLYEDKSKILNGILRIVKQFNTNLEKLTHEKTIEEINEEVYKTKIYINLDETSKQAMKNIYNIESKRKAVEKKYDAIPIFLDFCYNYFITKYLPDYPAFHFNNENEFLFVTNIIKVKFNLENELFNKINKLFLLFLNDKFFKELIIENPPYYLTNYGKNNLEEDFNTKILPELNNLYDCIVELNKDKDGENGNSKKNEENGKVESNEQYESVENGEYNGKYDESDENENGENVNTNQINTNDFDEENLMYEVD